MNILLLSGALFNWAVAIVFFFAYKPFFSLLNVSPIPENPTFVYLFSSVVFTFGIGYYWASTSLKENIGIVKLGIIGKWSLFFCGVFLVVFEYSSWQLLIPLSVDFIYGAMFINLLRSVR